MLYPSGTIITRNMNKFNLMFYSIKLHVAICIVGEMNIYFNKDI